MSKKPVSTKRLSPSMALVPTGESWEDLRRESRRLENEIDSKLVSFGKLSSSYHHRESGSADSSLVSNPGHLFETMSLEIDQLLAKLHSVNDLMNSHLSRSSGPTPTSALYHTLQRHNEILQDYTQEFNRTKNNIIAQRQREELLGNPRKDGYKTSSALNRRTELFLKEHEHIRSSDRLTDDAISIAISTKDNLTHQKSLFSSATSRMQSVAHQFPLINSVVQKINLRKRRDSLILGGVVAVCIVILLVIALR